LPASALPFGRALSAALPAAQICPIRPLFFSIRRAPRGFAGSVPQLAGRLSSTATFPRRIAS